MTIPDAHTHLSCYLPLEEQDFCFPACVCATCPSDWKDVAKLARQFPGKIIPSFGIHPWYIDDSSQNSLADLSSLLNAFPQAGVGEIGLDHTKCASASLALQQEIFEKQLILAQKSGRVISIHCVSAWGRLLDSLEKLQPSRILIHGWKGPSELAPRLNALDCYFSVGAFTMNEQSLRSIPANRILVESDEHCGSAEQAAEYLASLRSDISLAALEDNFKRLWSS